MQSSETAAREPGAEVPHGVLQAMQPQVTMRMMLCADEDGDVLGVWLMAHLSQAQLTQKLLQERMAADRHAAAGPWRRPAGAQAHTPENV